MISITRKSYNNRLSKSPDFIVWHRL